MSAPALPANADFAHRTGDSHKYLIAFAVVLASLLQVIDSSIVNVALPDMMGNLGASLDEIAWVTTGYILANVTIIPMTGWLGGVFGRKRYFVGSVVLFTAASFMCGAARSLATLIVWRVIQGIGGGALMTVSQAVLLEAFPPEEAGMAMALFGMGVMVGPTIGPTLGGWITDNYNWPWIFYINVPLGALAAFMIAAYVHDSEHQKKPATIDYQGIALLLLTVVPLQYVLEHGQREDWFDSRLIVGLSATSVAAAVGLVWRELTTDHPIIDFRVLRHRQMWVGTVLGVVLGVGLFAATFTIPVFLQGNLRMTAEQTGLVLLPGALATALSMAIVGKATRAYDARLLITIGASLFVWAMWDLAHVTGESGAGDFLWPLVARGVGLGLMFVPLTTLTLADLARAELPQATGLFNFFRQLGGSLGIAAVATIVTHDTAAVRAALVTHVTTTDAGTAGRLAMLTRAFVARGADPLTAHARALKALDLQVTGQASVIAFGHTYILAGLLIAAIVPLLVLVRNAGTPANGDIMLE
jgi:DHA2 family multidrug resistance protein